MNIKDIPGFRTWFKNLHRSRQNEFFDEHFMGATYGDHTGFFGMYHGEKEDIYGFLRKEVEMAEDGQAIYEFLQNAADSNSTHFYMFYDENYFVAINNGEPFTKEGVKSILNIGQSHGKTDCGKIGRFGIGFKLVHRLVGKSAGLEELIDEYKGPQMFSWSQRRHLEEFLKLEDVIIDPARTDDENPWLLKILMTNFPAAPGERVLDLDYAEREPYPLEELNRFRSFLAKCLPNIDQEALGQGTMFFLELGENKIDLLRKDEDNLEEGIENSLFFLKSIEKVIVNGKELARNPSMAIEDPMEVMTYEDEFKAIGLSEERDRACPIVIQLGFMPYKEGLQHIKNKPNFFKYFPIGDESNGLNFIVHSNVFQIGSNRRTIHNDTKNHKLLELISSKTISLLDSCKETAPEKFLGIFSNILVSDAPKNQGNIWQNKWLYAPLLAYIQTNTPTAAGGYRPADEVLIKRTSLQVEPSLLGIDKEWFAWGSPEDKDLLKEAQDKLELKKWSIANLLEEGDLEKVNSWIQSLDEEQYQEFLLELDASIPKKNFESIHFLKCSDGTFTSINELANSSSTVAVIDKLQGISGILNELGVGTTLVNFSRFDSLRTKASEKLPYLKVENELRIFDNFIRNNTAGNNLSAQKRKDLFQGALMLHGVGPQALRQWLLFPDVLGEIKPLSAMINPRVEVEPWLRRFKLNTGEILIKEMEEHLLDETEILDQVIVPNWEDITSHEAITIELTRFYDSIVSKYYDEEKHRQVKLAALPYIHTKDGFKTNGEVFYSKGLASAGSYAILQEAVEKSTGFLTPSEEILRFLEMAPFSPTGRTILPELQDCVLTAEESRELVAYCSRVSENVFQKGSFHSDGDAFVFELGGKLQYYAREGELGDFIQDHLDEVFAPLPLHLDQFKTSEGILRNDALYSKILLELGEEAHELWEKLLPLLKHKDLIQEYLLSFDHIKIEAKSTYDKSSPEYQLLSHAFQYLEEPQIEELRAKISIGSKEGEAFSISEVLASDKVHFDIENKSYPVYLSKVLPNSKSFGNASVLNDVTQALKRAGLPKGKLTTLLGAVGTGEDEVLKSAAEELIDSLQGEALKNASQLAFALLYEKQFGSGSMGDLNVYDVEGDTQSFDSGWYTTPYSFITGNAILHQQYAGVERILQLGEENHVFSVDMQDVIRLYPSFGQDEEYHVPFLKENLDMVSCRSFFDLLYTQFSKSPHAKYLFEKASWSRFNGKEAEKIFQFDPEICCIGERELLLEEEVAPTWLHDWLMELPARKALLQSLAFQLPEAGVFALRGALSKTGTGKDVKFFEEGVEIPYQLLLNTFDWLAITGNCLIGERHIGIFEWLLEVTGDNWNDTWEPDLDLLKEKAIECTDSSYLKWRESDDESFDILNFDGLMPYVFIYEDTVIAKKSADNYYFDEDSCCLFVNSHITPLQKVLNDLMNDGTDHLTYESYSRFLGLQNEESHDELIQLRKVALEYATMKEKLARYEQYSDGPEIPLTATDNIGSQDQKAYNLEAKEAVKRELSGHESYDCSAWDTFAEFSIVRGKVTKNGVPIDLVVKSARKGDIFLNPGEFNVLVEDTENQLFVYNGESVKNVTLKNIFEANSCVQVQFDTNYMPLEIVGKMAEVFQYIKNTKFVVSNPNFSTVDFLEGFMGVNNVNEGPVSEALEDEY